MKNLLYSLLLLALITQVSSCNLFESVSKKEELPPITQEGKNTFGCLVNGKVWLPKGYDGTANINLSYDPNFAGGSFNLSAYRIDSDRKQDILIGSDSLKVVGNFNFNSKDSPLALFFDTGTKCSYNEPNDYLQGKLQIRRLDVTNRIIAGTFHFTAYKQNCDSIKVTQGRFDKKF